ncbi:hypothetical protein J437_LFUL005164 [Ladona fulva]|uniref:Uncharacterized protein n=1 Tax=Ladona fulva TaxID=123851 RepID=A0A8K0KRN6_LADFU|nr:hypothetical protein J437_LFUL005164 [Ladona fulva]
MRVDLGNERAQNFSIKLQDIGESRLAVESSDKIRLPFNFHNLMSPTSTCTLTVRIQYGVKTPCAAIRAFRHGKESESARYVAGEHTAMQFVADYKSSTVVAGGPQRRSC